MRAAGIRQTWIVWFVGAAGAAFFASKLAGAHAGDVTPRNIVIAVVAALVVYLALNVDPAWLITGGLVAGIFNGNWKHLGFGSTAVPDRLLLAAGLAALFFRIPPQAKDRPQIRSRWEYWVIGAAGLYVVLSAIASGSFIGDSVGFFRLLDRFGLLPFFMFAVAPVAFRTRRQRNILLGALVVTGAYLGVTTCAETLGLHPLVWPKYILDANIGITHGRGRGPFAAADANGLALVVCATAAVIGYVEWRRPLVRTACALIAAAGFCATFMTLTRSVWVGTGVTGIVTLLAFRETRRFLIPAAAAMTAGVVFCLVAIPGLGTKAHDRQHEDRPVWDRKNSNAAAIRMLGARPLFGFGWDRYVDENSDYFVQDPNIPLTGYRYPLHNVYLSNAVELGVLGAALWLAAVAAAVGGAMFRRGPPELLAWRIGLVALGVQWAVESALAPFPYAFPNMMLWTWAGIVAGLVPAQLPVRTLAARRVVAPAS